MTESSDKGRTYCDIAGELRLNRLMQVMKDLSGDLDPDSSVNRYSQSMRQLFGDQGLISISLRGLRKGQYRVMRLLHHVDVVEQGCEEMPVPTADAPVREGGIVGDLIAWNRPTVLRDLWVEDDPVLGRNLAPYRMLVAFPIFHMGEVTNWVLFLHTEPDGFDQSSIESRFLQANLLGNLTNTKRISKELREANAWIEREIDEIAGIQRGLLPQGPPCAPGIDAAAYYATFDRAGGDYYDIIRTGPNNGASVFIVADASGHGPSAAVVVAIASTLLHARPEHLGGPAELLTYLNRHLVRRRINQSFVTALVCMVDDERKRLTMSSAGHPMAVLCRDGSARELPQAGGIPLGISLKADYVEAEYELREGDTLLMYTDGVTEARAPSGQQFGEERLLSALACSGSPGECIENILKVLREHEAGRRPTDDQTMLVLKMTQGGQSAADVD